MYFQIQNNRKYVQQHFENQIKITTTFTASINHVAKWLKGGKNIYLYFLTIFSEGRLVRERENHLENRKCFFILHCFPIHTDLRRGYLYQLKNDFPATDILFLSHKRLNYMP